MTSTSFNVGVDVESKSSSRVLRPPGGGHTDIFGLNEPVAAPVRRDDNRRNASSILEGTNQEKPSDVLQNARDVQNGNLVNDTIVESTKDTSPKEPPRQAPVIQTQEAPKRGRVPPGGFSSGLW
ncbi:hypothetical protein HHI36_003557 [Cryptolaemus montrouzieri]|uniref:Microtubule-associated protein Jupiter n=1 Tax=Cryptolaemus montrouzieri TaxID=559131 RepID=A0ABD2PDS3_9CUCU